MKRLIIPLILVAMALFSFQSAQAGMTMSEAKQIAKIRLIDARLRCLAKHAKPVYIHSRVIDVPTSHLEFVTDYYGQPLPEDTAMPTDLTYSFEYVNTRSERTPFVGFLIDKGCLLLPPPPR